MGSQALDEQAPAASVTSRPSVSAEATDDRRAAYAPEDLVTSKYRLERPLGAGGQATVWEARNLALDARVALKLLHDGEPDEAQATRLLREARAVAQLGHPAVVRVFDLATTTRGDWFIVMELLEGKSLADQLLERGRLSARETVQLLLPIVDALGAAHAQGVVHRDVKPDNVFLARVGTSTQPKLLDFGIAKLKREHEMGWKTAAGTVLGTPAYLSPEQAEGLRDIDHRSDIWSLSATLYECVTGLLPFDAATDQELFSQIAEHDPAPIVQHAAGDAGLWAIVQRGLAKAPADRWPSMQAFGEALARWLVQHGIRHDACGVSLHGTWLPADGAGGHTQPTLPPVALAPELNRPPRDTATPARTRRGLAVATAITLPLVATMLAFSLRPGPTPSLAQAKPVQVPSVVAAASGAPPSVRAASPKGDASPADLPRKPAILVTPLSTPTPAPATTTDPVNVDSKPKVPHDRLRPARGMAEPRSPELLSPYR